MSTHYRELCKALERAEGARNRVAVDLAEAVARGDAPERVQLLIEDYRVFTAKLERAEAAEAAERAAFLATIETQPALALRGFGNAAH